VSLSGEVILSAENSEKIFGALVSVLVLQVFCCVVKYNLILFIYLFIYLLHGLYRTLSHSQSEESQVRSSS